MTTDQAVRAVLHPAPVGQVVMIGAVFGFIAGVLDLVVYLVGRLFGVPFEVARAGSSTLTAVPWFAVVVVCVLAGVVGALLASLLRSVVSGPALVMVIGFGVGLASLVIPLVQPADVPWSTRILLAVMHVVATVVIVPAVSRGLTPDDPPPGVLPR